MKIMRSNTSSSVLLLLITMITFSCESKNEYTPNPNPSDSGLYDLFLYDVNSHVTTQITSSPDEGENSYSFSPDSKKILYANRNGINEMNINGSGNRIIARSGGSPSYSPDGKQIAFVDTNKLYIMDVDGTDKVALTNKKYGLWYPVWSKDGQKIACTSDLGLCLVTLDGTVKVFTHLSSSDWYDWSYNSKDLYYSKFTSDSYSQIIRYNIAEDKEYQVTNDNKYNYSPRCSPLNNEVVFVSTVADYGADLFLISADGSGSQSILHKNTIASPCWSPEGDKIVFVTDYSDLAIVDKTGENYKVINEIPGACMEPKWSPDGRYILYYRAVFYL